MSEIQKKLEERRALWESIQASPDWEKYRLGGTELESIDSLSYYNNSINLGLPWKQTSDSRASWFFYQLGTNGAQIASFIREMMKLDNDVVISSEEYNVSDESLTLGGGKGNETSARLQYGDQQVVIIDIGSHMTKVGWAAESVPAKSFRSQINNKNAVDRGVVSDWDLYQSLIEKCYKEIETKPESYPLLFCIAPKTPQGHKVKIAKFLFETLKVPSVYFCSTSYAGLCWSEKMHGLIVNVGGGIIHTVPYYEGVCISHAINRLDVTGQDITNHLIQSCQQRGDIINEEEADVMKRKLFWVSADPENKGVGGDTNGHGFRSNGAQVPLGNELYLGAEMLFCPDRSQKENLGIPEMIQKTIAQCDIDTRKALWSNIVICGGSSMFPGFKERLQKEVNKLTPGDTVAFVNSPDDRLNNTHSGANNLAFYDEFYNLCITAEEFAIEGEDIFSEKCNNS